MNKCKNSKSYSQGWGIIQAIDEEFITHFSGCSVSKGIKLSPEIYVDNVAEEMKAYITEYIDSKAECYKKFLHCDECPENEYYVKKETLT